MCSSLVHGIQAVCECSENVSSDFIDSSTVDSEHNWKDLVVS